MKQKFDVLAVPGNNIFCVASEKAEDFKNLKPNLEIRKEIEKNSKQFRVNNLVSDGPVLIKTKKLNKK